MKKLISIILMITTILSLAVVPMTTSAKTKTKKTYIASEDIYVSGKAYVYAKINSKHNEFQDDKRISLYYVGKNGKEKHLTYCGYNFTNFYLRGDTVYFNFGGSRENICSININTKKVKTIFKNGFLIGGYGKNVIVRDSNKNVYSVTPKGEKTKLCKNYYNIFNGCLYSADKKFNLANNKITNVARKSDIYTTNSYLYYINKKGNLTSLDKKGIKRNVDVMVTSIIGANDGKTVLYTKGNKVYRRTGTNKKIELADITKLRNTTGVDKNFYPEETTKIVSGSLSGNSIVLAMMSDTGAIDTKIIKMDINGKNQKVIYSFDGQEYDSQSQTSLISVKIHNNKVYTIFFDYERFCRIYNAIKM